jgi:acyl dehydratase
VVTLSSTVLAVTPNAKNPSRGTARLQQVLTNEAGETVYSMIGNILVVARPLS